MSKQENILQQQLTEREEKGLLRKLTNLNLPFDFCSNDYLGFARSEELQKNIEQEVKKHKTKNGAGGSRLLSGNTTYIEETEQFIADFHQAESGLIFNSGYDANIGLLSSVPQRGDTIISDELIHASLIDGIRLSHANRLKFKHNNTDDLENKLKTTLGNRFVVVESVYSMNGDTAPLVEIAKICKQYNANLIVDEAHATGIFGRQGRGLVQQLNLEKEVFASVVTFGKALGIHGAIVLGSSILRDYLINFSRSFIYTTAAPLHNIIAVKNAYLMLAQSDKHLLINKKIELYNQLIQPIKQCIIPSESAIQTIVFNNNKSTKAAAQHLQKNGFDVKAILSPTVPEGTERLRICLHTYNSDEEIKELVNHLKNIH
jgi:8-amino-7-oxononanoate synthase